MINCTSCKYYNNGYCTNLDFIKNINIINTIPLDQLKLPTNIAMGNLVSTIVKQICESSNQYLFDKDCDLLYNDIIKIFKNRLLDVIQEYIEDIEYPDQIRLNITSSTLSNFYCVYYE